MKNMYKTKFEDFKKTWEELIAKIENDVVDGDAVSLIRIHFELNMNSFELNLSESELDALYLDMKLLQSKLEVALQIAHSRYRLRNRGILARVFRGITEKTPKI
jgi:hypothetical protein